MVTILLRQTQPLPKETQQRIRKTACYEREVHVTQEMLSCGASYSLLLLQHPLLKEVIPTQKKINSHKQLK